MKKLTVKYSTERGDANRNFIEIYDALKNYGVHPVNTERTLGAPQFFFADITRLPSETELTRILKLPGLVLNEITIQEGVAL